MAQVTGNRNDCDHIVVLTNDHKVDGQYYMRGNDNAALNFIDLALSAGVPDDCIKCFEINRQRFTKSVFAD